MVEAIDPQSALVAPGAADFLDQLIPDWVPDAYRDAVLCPTTNIPCPARLTTVQRYMEEPGGSPELEIELERSGFSRVSNRAKLAGKFAEWRAREVLFENCTGEENGVCPMREVMDQSPTRKVAVTVIRRILHGDGE